MPYNYNKFRGSDYNLLEFGGPKPGEKAPDFEAITLDGAQARLSDYFGRPIVLETGSISCPMYVDHISSMNRLASDFPNVLFFVLYVREAHPGGRLPPHRSLDEKSCQAGRLQREEGENRMILIDDLEGSAHEKYGSLPNMVYVIDSDGTIVFSGEWNLTHRVGQVLEQLEKGKSPRRLDSEFRPPSLKTAFRVLRRSGWDAIWDFVVSLPNLIWQHFHSTYRKRRS